jgi:hypothetical protein
MNARELRELGDTLRNMDKLSPIRISDYNNGLQMAIKEMIERISSGSYEYVRLVVSNHWASEGYWIEFIDEPIRNLIDDRIVIEWRKGQQLPSGAAALAMGRKVITELTGKIKFE